MYLTAKQHISRNTRGGEYITALRALCYHAARMYNVGLYSVRQHFFNTGEYLSYYDNYHLCKSNENYAILLSSTSQQILRLVERDMKSFFALLKLKQDGKYSEDVHLPRYKDKTGLMICFVQGQLVRVHDGKVRIGVTKELREMYNLPFRYMEFTIPKNVDPQTIKEVRIRPLFGGTEFDIEFIHRREVMDPSDADGVLSIDPGVTNLLTCTAHSNGRPESFIIDGRYIKNVNCYYNKTVARLRGIYDRDKKIEGTTKRMARLSKGRKNRINTYFDAVAKYIVEYCRMNSIGKVVIGYNKEIKQETDMGAVSNQNFVYIPFYKLRSKLMSKCELYGIVYESQEESYTSKACALTLDRIPDYGDSDIPEFSGYREKRGSYKIKGSPVRVNADVNGSINIYRKYLKCKSKDDLSSDDVRVLVNGPVLRINPLRG